MQPAKNSKPIVAIAGFVLIITGLFLNMWVIERLFSPDRQLILLTKILISVMDVFLIGTGIFLLIVRSFSKLFIVYASLLVSMILVETGLSYYFDVSKEFFIPNPRGTGSYRLKKNLNIQRKIGAATFLFRTNSLGMPWREVNQNNPEQKIRIAFVGDSFTFGCCATRVENSFVGTFDRKISSAYQVLNFGVVGYGLADEKLQLKEEVLAFRPRYLFLMLYNGNDFSDTFLSLSPEGKMLGLKERSPDERKDIPSRFTTVQRTARPITTTATFRVVNSFLTTPEDPRKIFEDPNRFDSWAYWSRVSYPPIGLKAKDLSLQMLSEILELCKGNNIQIFIVTIPYVNQVYAPELRTDKFDFRFPQKYIEEFSRTHSVPYLDLLPPLRSFARNSNAEIYVPEDGHFNDEGHRLVGNLLLNYFVEVVR
jgi:lysophospholipase L1-like esterase